MNRHFYFPGIFNVKRNCEQRGSHLADVHFHIEKVCHRLRVDVVVAGRCFPPDSQHFSYSLWLNLSLSLFT